MTLLIEPRSSVSMPGADGQVLLQGRESAGLRTRRRPGSETTVAGALLADVGDPFTSTA